MQVHHPLRRSGSGILRVANRLGQILNTIPPSKEPATQATPTLATPSLLLLIFAGSSVPNQIMLENVVCRVKNFLHRIQASLALQFTRGVHPPRSKHIGIGAWMLQNTQVQMLHAGRLFATLDTEGTSTLLRMRCPLCSRNNRNSQAQRVINVLYRS